MDFLFCCINLKDIIIFEPFKKLLEKMFDFELKTLRTVLLLGFSVS